jgi:glycosyltransferase involved in cell wall biosynthesis
LDEPVPEQLADRVIKLLEDSELREQMGKAARARYLAEFTEEAADRKLADWLSEVAVSDIPVAGEARSRRM